MILKISNDIHLIKNYQANNIPNDIEEKIKDVINSLPLCKNLNINRVTQDVGYWLAGSNASDWQNQFDNGFMNIDYDFDNLNDFKNKEDLIDSRDDYGYQEGI